MIYITGDTHGEQQRFSSVFFPRENCWTAEDCLIVCGDFGFLFLGTDEETAFLDHLATKPYTICFCDGNHENFDLIDTYPEKIWNGGRVHQIRHNIFHLMRGQVFEIQGKRILTMGGAYSIDKYRRTEGYSWWKAELPDGEEYRRAAAAIDACGRQVDYIVTHTAPREIIRRMGHSPDLHDLELTGFLEWIMYNVDFSQWFFGHWHRDEKIDPRFRALWFDVVEIKTG